MNVLVLRLSALGDVIHTIPAVATLGDANVSWVVEAPYRELVEIVAGVKAIPVRMKQWTRKPSDMRAAIRAMRGADVSIDFQGLVKSAMIGWLARAPERVGFDKHAIREKPALLFTNRKVNIDTRKHVVEQNIDLARSSVPRFLGPSGSTEEPRNRGTVAPRWSAFPEDPENKLAQFASERVILPGAGKPEKLWPVERWREVARRTNAVIAWGPNERELAERIGGRVAPPTNLRELAFLLRNAALVIGADTGPLHLAAALGTRVAGLYGPTHVRRNGPYGQLDHCVNAKSMDEISVEAVMNLVERVAAE